MKEKQIYEAPSIELSTVITEDFLTESGDIEIILPPHEFKLNVF